MLRKSVLLAILAAITAALTITVTQPASSAAPPTKIMPLGDSITAGPGCWRALLWDRLQRTGYTNIDFVGTQPGGGCHPAHDGDHEGHGGYLATGIANQNQLPPWLAATKPDVVFMHLGTNDMWGGNIPVPTVLAAYTKLIGQMRANNPNMKIIVAQILPMNPSGCSRCDVTTLNRAIPGWAAGLTSAQSPITVADLWTGFDTATDTTDGVHPNDAGFRKMADSAYPALTRVLDGGPPPLPSASPTAPPSPSASPSPPSSPSPSASPSPPSRPSPSPSPGGGGCIATYSVVSQWPGGFQGEVRVRNGAANAATAWTVNISFADGQQPTQAWNATVTASGAAVTAKNLAWNGNLAPNGSTTFGFLASWQAANRTPSISCTFS